MSSTPNFIELRLDAPETIEAFAKATAQEVAGNKAVVAIDFTAKWCGPCKIIGPHFKAFSEEERFKGITFFKVDVDDFAEYAQKHEIRAMPTFKFLVGGALKDELVGADKNKLEQKLAELAKLVESQSQPQPEGQAA
ncbi:hypothetical protein H4R18_003861 [Coemansia javaensis]|uniref:Thioredoxin domain-containing protein n=1 Tax=Coemansia javaensis TaxID=2761396 RepID=A0A9W8H7V8_9FUNG|nr:hypothetical protein H4R18_003861 [Coemansia javaensis]